jgi:2-polyprenyl-3-methyl-5-hydroxy-6-metoxy-1,4-benzoquinol methylase
VYSTDLAYIHDAGFSDFARRAAPELIRTLRNHGIRRGLVVDVGCGGAPLAEPLMEAGYEVLGIDASPAMIHLARARAPEARFRIGSLATTRIPRSAAVLALNEVVSYVPRRRVGLVSFFSRVHSALQPGGLLIFDFVASVEGRTYAARSRAGADWAIVARASADRRGRTLTRDITTFRKVGRDYRKSHETHRITVYDPEEIQRALRRLGFRVTTRRSYGRLRLLPSDIAVIAEKR